MKKTIAVLAAAAVAICASVGLWHEDAAAPMDPPAIVQTVPADSGTDFPDGDADEQRRTRRAQSGARTVLKMLFALPVTLVGHAATAILGAVGATVLTAVRFMLTQVLGTFLALLAVLCILFKALFPDRPLREMLTRRNLLRILVLSILIPLACRILEMSFPQARHIVPLVKAALLMLAVLWLWHRAFSLRGRFSGRIRRLLWCRQGVCLAACVLALCGASIWLNINRLADVPQVQGAADTLFTYLVCAATAFAIYRHVTALRKKRGSMRVVAECDGFRAEIPCRKDESI